MSKIRAINDDSFSPLILKESLPWENITDVHVIYQLKDGTKHSRSSCNSWGIWLEMLAMMQYEAMQHVARAR